MFRIILCKSLKSRFQIVAFIALLLCWAGSSEAHYIQTHLKMTELAETQLKMDQNSHSESILLLFQEEAIAGKTYFEFLLDGIRDADLRAGGLYGIDASCGDPYPEGIDENSTYAYYNPDYDYVYAYKAPDEGCNHVQYMNIPDWPIGDHSYHPRDGYGTGAYKELMDRKWAITKKHSAVGELNWDAFCSQAHEDIHDDDSPIIQFLTNLYGTIDTSQTLESHLSGLDHLLQKTNALEMAEEFHTRAEDAWEEGRKIEAMQSLGIVIHLVQDMTVPNHVRRGENIDLSEEEFESQVWTEYLLKDRQPDPINISYTPKSIRKWIEDTANETYEIATDQVTDASMATSVRIGIESTAGVISSFFQSANAKAKIVLSGEDQEKNITSDAIIIGTGAKETLNIDPDINVDFTAGDGDRVNLPYDLEHYEITSMGNHIWFSDVDKNKVITIIVTGSSTVGFSDGSAATLEMVFSPGGPPQVQLGGVFVGPTPLDHDLVELWFESDTHPDTITNSIGMTFNYIEPGTFMMGSPEDELGRDNDETQHQVTLTQGFYIQTTPVTQGQWKAVMGESSSPYSWDSPFSFPDCGDDCPVGGMSWGDAQDFLEALNQLEGTTKYALPTEAQWEYSARAGSTTAFANGQITKTSWDYDPILDSMGWYIYNSEATYGGCFPTRLWDEDNSACVGIHPVAQKDPNAWGLYDMHGNVWEWVEGWYGDYPNTDVVDPTGPASGVRTLRGGSAMVNIAHCRSASRVPMNSRIGAMDFGFRLVRFPDIADDSQHTVKASAGPGGNVTSSINTIMNGDKASFNVNPDSDFSRINAVGGSCKAGSWSGNTYTIDTITRNCSVDFYFTFTPDDQKDPKDISNSLGMDFVFINPGTFTMGSPEDEPGRFDNETQHQVTLTQGYYMQTTPVTQGQWEAVMGDNPSYFSDCGDDCPIENVPWNDVQDFIYALNDVGEGTYRLPTEAEWEYSARAGSTTALATGEITIISSNYDPVLDRMGWYTYNSQVDYSPNWYGKGTHPVAQKGPNAWGLYDMHGNVWEWVADWYGTYPTSAVTNPTGPTSGTYRVARGGGWGGFARTCRSAFRYSRPPDLRHSNIGFRLVLLPGH